MKKFNSWGFHLHGILGGRLQSEMFTHQKLLQISLDQHPQKEY